MSVQEKNKDICHDECRFLYKELSWQKKWQEFMKKTTLVTNQHINQYNDMDEF